MLGFSASLHFHAHGALHEAVRLKYFLTWRYLFVVKACWVQERSEDATGQEHNHATGVFHAREQLNSCAVIL